MPTVKLRRPGYGEKLGKTWWIVIAVLYVPASLLVRTRYRNLQKLPQQGGAGMTAGMAGACIEIALGVQSLSLQAAVLGIVAVAAGIAGAVSCAVIGHWATRGALLRRRLWDDFVRSILKSEIRQTAWTVRASELNPTNVGQNGQDL